MCVSAVEGICLADNEGREAVDNSSGVVIHMVVTVLTTGVVMCEGLRFY